MYMQAAFEQISGRSLEEIARERVFQPLGMTSANFDGKRFSVLEWIKNCVMLSVQLIV